MSCQCLCLLLQYDFTTTTIASKLNRHDVTAPSMLYALLCDGLPNTGTFLCFRMSQEAKDEHWFERYHERYHDLKKITYRKITLSRAIGSKRYHDLEKITVMTFCGNERNLC
jgi:hypothetical protein